MTEWQHSSENWQHATPKRGRILPFSDLACCHNPFASCVLLHQQHWGRRQGRLAVETKRANACTASTSRS